MLAHKTTDSTPPSEKVSSGVPESTVEAVFSPKTQDNGFLQTTHSPSVTLMPGFFGPSQHGANFGSPWSIDPSQPSPFQDQFEMDITTAEPTQPQTTQDWSSMNLTIDPRQLQLVYDGMPVNFAQPQTTQDWLSMSSTIDHMQPQLTQDWLSMNPTIDPMHLI
ncbi:hypothetical protein CEP53_001861 [Fusarium sp. AF-6]|nr:hypothetical protein CEP53_001861 [Fusarium sp. AF-6]